jgi:hypothetical protein
MNGNTAVIGSEWDNYQGGAYVFVKAADGTWTQQAKLTALDGADSDSFGASVAVSGDTAVIGAYYDNDNGYASGSAYVFIRDANGTWTQQAKLLPSDGAAEYKFGYSVAVSGDIAVIGDWRDYDNDDLVGSAYIFVRAANGTWTQQAKLLASDSTAGDKFGASVAVDGNTAVIGAWGNDDEGLNTGSAYIFVQAVNGTWTQQAKLLASDGAAYDLFGYSVAVFADTAVIGAYGDDDKGEDAGSAYVFVRAADGTWTQQAKLLANDGSIEKLFGWSVAVSGDTAVIGAWGDDENGWGSGAAYVFVRAANGAWTQQSKLLDPDGGSSDRFGWSVAVSGETALIGAIYDDDKGDDAGAVYVFGSSSPAPARLKMAPIYKLLLKGRSLDAPCPSCPNPGEL